MLRSARQPTGAEDEGGIVVRKSEKAYSWLREEILSFRMQPGLFIDKIEVCETLGVSKQPVTAALTRLEQEGLVEIYPQRGSYVARLRLGSMTESLFIRGALEAAAARRLAEEGNDLLLHALKRNVEAQEAAIAADNPGRYYLLDQEFHLAIARAVPFPQVAHQIDIGLATVKRCHELFRPDVNSISSSYEGHRRIIAALEAHDGASVSREMTEHVKDYGTMLRDFAAARPELFVG